MGVHFVGDWVPYAANTIGFRTLYIRNPTEPALGATAGTWDGTNYGPPAGWSVGPDIPGGSDPLWIALAILNHPPATITNSHPHLIPSGVIPGSYLIDGTLDASIKLQLESIDSTVIGPDSIITRHILAGQVTVDKLEASVLVADNILAGTMAVSIRMTAPDIVASDPTDSLAYWRLYQGTLQAGPKAKLAANLADSVDINRDYIVMAEYAPGEITVAPVWVENATALPTLTSVPGNLTPRNAAYVPATATGGPTGGAPGVLYRIGSLTYLFANQLSAWMGTSQGVTAVSQTLVPGKFPDVVNQPWRQMIAFNGTPRYIRRTNIHTPLTTSEGYATFQYNTASVSVPGTFSLLVSGVTIPINCPGSQASNPSRTDRVIRWCAWRGAFVLTGYVESYDDEEGTTSAHTVAVGTSTGTAYPEGTRSQRKFSPASGELKTYYAVCPLLFGTDERLTSVDHEGQLRLCAPGTTPATLAAGNWASVKAGKLQKPSGFSSNILAWVRGIVSCIGVAGQLVIVRNDEKVYAYTPDTSGTGTNALTPRLLGTLSLVSGSDLTSLFEVGNEIYGYGSDNISPINDPKLYDIDFTAAAIQWATQAPDTRSADDLWNTSVVNESVIVQADSAATYPSVFDGVEKAVLRHASDKNQWLYLYTGTEAKHYSRGDTGSHGGAPARLARIKYLVGPPAGSAAGSYYIQVGTDGSISHRKV